MTGLVSLFSVLPEVAQGETRSIWIRGDPNAVAAAAAPTDNYGFLEYYCDDPTCDCQRVLIIVQAASTGRTVATISHSFDPPPAGGIVSEQTFLDPLNPQSPFAAEMLRLFRDVALDDRYTNRLRRHYRMVKDLVTASPRRRLTTKKRSPGRRSKR